MQKNFVCWLLPLTLRVYCGIPLCARMYSNMRRVNRAPCPHMSGCNCIVEADPSVWESCLCPVIARWANILISCQIPCYQLNALIDPIRICDRTNILLNIVVGHSEKQPRSFELQQELAAPWLIVKLVGRRMIYVLEGYKSSIIIEGPLNCEFHARVPAKAVHRVLYFHKPSVLGTTNSI